jgi:MSHA biogenesis protein MshQ
VNYNGAVQTVDVPTAATYYHLTLSGSGAKTMTGVTTIGGDLSISGSATMTSNAAFTVTGALNYSSTGATTLTAATPISIGSYNQTAGTFSAGANTITVSGNWNETGTFNPGTGTVTLSGATAQTISGTSPVGFNNLTVTNGASPNITLATNVTVAGTLAGTVTLTFTCPTDYTLTSTTPAQVLHSCPTVVSSINRANPDPTSAATVSWTVTFSKSVTGVDATAFTLAASGVSGAYIASVTGSGTTWTVTANTGIGSGTLGLNQTGPGSVVPTLTGTFTGQIYTISATPALAEYRMDEASWNGTVGEVVDSSGSGNNAQSFNSANTDATTPVIAGSPGTCRYGVFDNGTITQGYVQTPLPNLTTDFTFTAWIRTTNNTVGGQRILIDDQNNSGGYGLSLADGATGILRFYSRGITPIILDSTYTIANNTWYFVAAVADITNQKRTLYVFNAAGALLNSTTEAAWTGGTWGTDAGPVSIGAETNASGESPASFHFKGNLDEVRVYQKVLSQNALAAIAAQTHACPVYAPDHILILQDGSAIACNPESVTVRACANSDCSSLYTGGVSGNLTAGGNSVAFAIASGYSDTTVSIHLPTNTSAADPQIVRLGTSSLSVTPADITSPYCTNTTTSTTNNTTACDVSVSKAGLLVTVPTLTAGFASGAVTLRAIRSSDSTTCVPLFASVTRTVAFWGQYLNPSTGTMNVQVNGSNVETTSSPAYVSTYSLSFDGTGTATTATLSSVRYDDAGLIQLGAHYAGSIINTPPDGGMIVTGTANFVVKPYGFKLTGLTCNSGDDPSTVSGHFCVAGGTFTGTVTPVKYDSSAANNLGAATPNFGQESTAQTVTFSPAALVNPTIAAGGTLSAFTSASVGSFSGGTSNQATATMVWPNVGTITIQPTMNYLAAGDLSSGGISDSTAFAGNVGRFYPHHFTLASGGITAACTAAGPFTYMDQPNLGVAFTVEARNKANTITSNYLYAATGGYANLGTVSAVAENANAGTDLGSRVSGLGSPIWAGGAYAVSAATATFSRLAAPDGTYDSLAVGVKVADVDATLANMNMRADTTGTCTTATAPATDCTAVQVGSTTTRVRYGRLRLFNAYGSELLDMRLPVRAEYWNSGGWLPNSADSCTTIPSPRNDIALGNCTGSLNCAAGGNMDPATHLPTAPVTLSGGANTITLTKPTCTVGPCPAGSLNLALNLGGLGSGGKDTSCICWAGTCPPQTPASQPTSSSAALPYLQFNWCSGTQDPTTGDPINDPNARATFGTAKNRFIYLRERY